jgi:hypothetical protein
VSIPLERTAAASRIERSDFSSHEISVIAFRKLLTHVYRITHHMACGRTLVGNRTLSRNGNLKRAQYEEKNAEGHHSIAENDNSILKHLFLLKEIALRQARYDTESISG